MHGAPQGIFMRLECAFIGRNSGKVSHKTCSGLFGLVVFCEFLFFLMCGGFFGLFLFGFGGFLFVCFSFARNLSFSS